MTTMTLRAVAAHMLLALAVGCSSGNGGGGGGGTGGTGGGGGSNTDMSQATFKRVFATRLTYSGNLSGLAGADQKCQLAADSLALGGTWRAWLSTSTTNAIDRVQSDQPYYLVDGTTKVFTNRANWTTLPLAPIQKGEDGSLVFPSLSGGCTGAGNEGPCVWTGTDVGGSPLPDLCSDWTSNGGTGPTGGVGSLVGTDKNWTNATVLPCNNQAHLYCFEN